MQVQRLFVDVHVQSARPSPVSVLPVVQNLDPQSILQMHADLVCLPRVQAALHEQNGALPGENRVSGNRHIAIRSDVRGKGRGR